jgi:hypothetical protein
MENNILKESKNFADNASGFGESLFGLIDELKSKIPEDQKDKVNSEIEKIKGEFSNNLKELSSLSTILSNL